MIIIEVKSYKGGEGKSTAVYAFYKALESAQIVDLDYQKTITRAAELTNSEAPVKEEEARGKYLIFDTPPYRQDIGLHISQKADYIIIPAKATYNSLLSLESLYGELLKKQLIKKSWLFFNEVRRPVDNTHKEVTALFRKNYPGLNFARTEWSTLKAFKEILLNPIHGKALEQTKKLLKEIQIL